MRKIKRKINVTNSLGKYISLIVTLVIIAVVFYPFVKEYSRRSSLKNSSKKTIKAIIIDEKAYNGNSPVSNSFSYKYKFEVDGKEYYGTSHDEQLRPGDTMEIEFVTSNPGYNAPEGYYK